jgi:hypothetical protein
MFTDNNKAIFDFKCFDPEPIQKLLELLQNQEVQAFLKIFIDNSMATSDLKILKRLADIEKALGLNGFSDFEEEHEQTIPEQLSLLAERIDSITKPTQESVIEPRTTLEHKATELVNYLKAVKPRHEEMFLASREITDFLKYELPEPLRMKNIVNPRQFKRDVLRKACEMFPFIILDKKKEGRRDVRIILKPENDTKRLNRTDPYIRSKPI